MNMDFSIREAILSATQSWPLVLAFGIMGVLLGLVAAFIWPSYHQATKALHVGLNVYQISEEPGVPGIANPQFIYADDYKNWQMATLNNVIYMDSILEGALSQLRSQDEYWTQIKREQLAGMLKVNWRNAGKWKLVAEHPQADFAAQAVTAWENSIIEKTHIAIGSARESLMLDLEIRALMNTQVQATTRLAILEEQLAGLESWRLIIDALPPDQPVDEDPHQGILQVCSSVNNYLGQIVFSETCPAVGSLPENYRTWIDNTILILNQQVQITETEIDALEMKKNLLAEDYAEATQNSLGLSGNMIIERVTDSPPSISVARSTATFVFVGGILGLIAWGLFWLTKISLNRKTLRSPEANA